MGNRILTEHQKQMIEIILKDRESNQLEIVDWKLGKNLVRFGFAEVLFQSPCAIKLNCKIETFLKLKSGEIPWSRMGSRKIYGNVLFQSQDNEDMFRGSTYKAFWYLARNIVSPVSIDPPIVKFNGSTKGIGHKGDQFYLTPKIEECVCCRESKINLLSKHHLVPHMFRRHMPKKIKGRSYHDIVLLCRNCHFVYERSADVLKNELAIKYGLPPDKTTNKYLIPEKDNRGRGWAKAIIDHGNKMPIERLNLLKKNLEEFLGEPITDKKLQELYQERVRKEINPNYVNLGKFVVERIEDFQEFAILWRKHFLEVMKPQFMPEYWDVNRPVCP